MIGKKRTQPEPDAKPAESQKSEQNATTSVASTEQAAGPSKAETKEEALERQKRKEMSQTTCKYFPHCSRGSNCYFLHPERTECRFYPNCDYPNNCRNIHPFKKCPLEERCTTEKCNYFHKRERIMDTNKKLTEFMNLYDRLAGIGPDGKPLGPGGGLMMGAFPASLMANFNKPPKPKPGPVKKENKEASKLASKPSPANKADLLRKKTFQEDLKRQKVEGSEAISVSSAAISCKTKEAPQLQKVSSPPGQRSSAKEQEKISNEGKTN